MPVYEFGCPQCTAIHEITRRFDDDSPVNCFYCGSPLKRKYTAPAISFKGGGFYRTDSRTVHQNAKLKVGNTPV